MSNVALARAHAALVTTDLASAFAAMAIDAAPTVAPSRSDVRTLHLPSDDAPTIPAPPTENQRKRWRAAANARKHLAKAKRIVLDELTRGTAKTRATSAGHPRTLLCPPPLGCVDACGCRGVLFCEPRCPSLAKGGAR
jgi:hypothetical protein